MELDIERLKHDLVFDKYTIEDNGLIIHLEDRDIFLPLDSIAGYIITD